MVAGRETSPQMAMNVTLKKIGGRFYCHLINIFMSENYRNFD